MKTVLPLKPLPTAARYYGKYRGEVLQNVDPMGRGRVVAMVHEVSAAPLPWATPCVPFVSGTRWSAPPVGAGVWIEFEQGKVELPVWTGCYSLPGGEMLFA